MAVTGIVKRHSRKCASHEGRRCNCSPTWEAWVWSPRDRKKIRRSFPSEAAAKAWRADAGGDVRRGKLRAPNGVTLSEAADKLLKGMKAGTVLNRTGRPYKPSATRGYEHDLNARILPELGAEKLTAIQRGDVQRLVNRMLAEGLSPSKIRNALMPLRVIFRRALDEGTVAVSPLERLALPRSNSKRARIAEPAEATALLAALPEDDRALWATAFYAGLRRGELRALRWEDVDLESGVIRVERGWDDQEGAIAPKSDSSIRTVPILAKLRELLVAHRERQGRETGLVFGTSTESPFTPSNVRRKAELVWANVKPKPLTPIGLHEARHTFASLLIDADVNPKAISRYLGHSSIEVTFDVYGGLFERHEATAASKVDGYLALADTAARLEQVAG
jgi:integrase